MINVVIINGAPQSGKDTFVRFCKTYCDDCECAHVINYSTVDTLKEFLIGLGWDGNKDDVSRKLLADMKDFWVNKCNNGPIREIMNNIVRLAMEYNYEDVIFFIHCREPLEIDKIKSVLETLSIVYPISVFTLVVHRSEAEKKAFVNEADKNTTDYRYDNECYNNGTIYDLKDNAQQYVDYILNKERYEV